MQMVTILLYVLEGVALLMLGFITYKLRFAFAHFRIKQQMTPLGVIEDMPSVTVCIPARNEDHAMTECLERVVACNYPKLEVLVLDDLSGDETSVLIKSFAHAGVRFIEGTKLPSGWLGKNHALYELAKEASGNYIFFMDVDTRIQPDTIEQLVAYATQEGAAMVSVLPRREDGFRASVLFSTLRYFWETVLHHKTAPATASNAWLINRSVLMKEFGGLQSYKSAIQPETKLSAALMAQGRYRFLIGTPQIGISYEKKWRSQLATSIRLLFPLLGNNFILAIGAALDMLILCSPFVIVVGGLLLGWGSPQWVALVLLVLSMLVYGWYLSRIWTRAWWLGAILWPAVLLQECLVLLVSIDRHRRKLVTWKGRKIVSTDTTVSL